MPQTQSYCEIPLSNGLFSKVDISDFDWLNQWRWVAMPRSSKNGYYAIRVEWMKGQGTVQTTYMHRLILGLEKGDRRQVDHKDMDTLNNTRENIRVATQSQNAVNRRPRPNKTGFQGVKQSSPRRWTAGAYKDSRYHSAGYHDSPEKAHKAYLALMKELFGEFHRSS